jgi:hypothetical protein
MGKQKRYNVLKRSASQELEERALVCVCVLVLVATRERVIPQDSAGRNGIYVFTHGQNRRTDRQTNQAIKRATIEENQPKERRKKWES